MEYSEPRCWALRLFSGRQPAAAGNCSSLGTRERSYWRSEQMLSVASSVFIEIILTLLCCRAQVSTVCSVLKTDRVHFTLRCLTSCRSALSRLTQLWSASVKNRLGSEKSGELLLGRHRNVPWSSRRNMSII